MMQAAHFLYTGLDHTDSNNNTNKHAYTDINDDTIWT